MKKSKQFDNRSIHIDTRRRVAVILIVAADAGLIAWGAMAALLPDYLVGPGSVPILQAEFESYTHLSWSAMNATSPSLTEFITILFRMYGIFNVAFGLMAVIIALNAFRKGERWAWWALFVGNTIAYGSAMTFDQVVNAIGVFEITEYVGIAAVYTALVITAKSIKAAKQKTSHSLWDPHTESLA